MKKFKYVLLFLILFLPLSVSAKKYDITNYYMDVNVNQNNIYNINEYYNILFFKDYNFERNILLRPKVYLNNGKFISYVTQVINVNASSNVSEHHDSKNYFIVFPGSNKQNETYTLSYYYNMGNDLESDNDIVFVNLLDGTLSTIPETFTFSITLPTEVDNKKIAFLKNGNLMKNGTENISYSVSGNRIDGTVNGNVSVGDILSVRITLPDGYFKGTVQTDGNSAYFLIIIPLIVIGLNFYGTKKYKREKLKIDNNIDITSMFDSVEVAYLYRGNITTTDLISVIFHLANDGYIAFKNYGSSSKVYFKIRKVKEYDKDNAVQKIVFDGLFINKDEIDIHDIEGAFNPYYRDAKRTLVNKRNKNRLFYDFAKTYKNILVIASYIGVVLLQVKPLYNYIGSYEAAIGVSFVVSLTVALLYRLKNKIIFSILALFSFILTGVSASLLFDFKLSLSVYLVGMILTFISIFFERRIPVRTVYGEQMLYDINNFRLELASLSNEAFRERTEQNPNYFFDMIPYMLVFDLSSWWFNRFKNEVTTQPSWYESSEAFTLDKLQDFIVNVISQLIVPVQTTKMYDDELLAQAPNKLL